MQINQNLGFDLPRQTTDTGKLYDLRQTLLGSGKRVFVKTVRFWNHALDYWNIDTDQMSVASN